VRADGSKFCSDACGMAYMKARIDGWTHRGGDRGGLWEAVKGAQRLEGVVAIPPTAVATTAPAKDEAAPAALGAARFRPAGSISADAYRPTSGPRAIVQPASGHDRIAREVARLRAQVAQWATRRAALVRELAMLGWREQLFARACARADVRGECGWDQRLCFGDEECAEFGAGVLESYDEHEAADGEDTGQEWWCRGVKKCDRHGGCVSLVSRVYCILLRHPGSWQKLRSADLAKEKELKEDAINKLTAREADNLQRILEMLAPQTGQLAETNGRSRKEHKVPAVDDATSRGQKRKAD
jgi:COMPASS component SPP1